MADWITAVVLIIWIISHHMVTRQQGKVIGELIESAKAQGRIADRLIERVRQLEKGQPNG